MSELEDASHEAWTSYWLNSDARPQGCLPNQQGELQDRVTALWHTFALTLSAGTNLLDLATGDGALLRHFKSARPDLVLIGIDAAEVPPRIADGFQILSKIACESLPFKNNHFGAVSSQFGIEYSDTDRSVQELARVLAPGGRFKLLIHHAESEIVVHNRDRLAALRWSADQMAGMLGGPAQPRSDLARFDQLKLEGAREFPGQRVALEIMTGAERIVTMGAGRPQRVAVALADLLRRINHEAERIAALLRAAHTGEQIKALAGHMRTADLTVDEPELIARARPFAWVIQGQK